MKHNSPETASVPNSHGQEPNPVYEELGRWQRIRDWLGAIARRNEREEQNGVSGNSSQTMRVPVGETDETAHHLDGRGDEDSPSVPSANEQSDHRDEYSKRVPDPYILGPQIYTDPSIWRPEGVEAPLTLDPQMREVGEWLERMDALVDSEPEDSSVS